MPEADLRETDLGEFESVVDELEACVIKYHKALRNEQPKFDLKVDGSRVTELDRVIERDWRYTIRKRCPGHSILGEEYGHGGTPSRHCWYLDPVDGTDDLSRGMPLHGYIIALARGGKPILAAIGHPALSIQLRATLGRGSRINGSSLEACAEDAFSDVAIAIPAIEDFRRDGDKSEVLLGLEDRFPNYRVYRNVYAHSAVIAGSLDAAVEFDVAAWDILATRLLVEESGGSYVEFRRVIGADGIEKSGAIFGKKLVVQEICTVLSAYGYQC